MSSGADWLSLRVIIRAVDLLGFIVSLFILIQLKTAFNSYLFAVLIPFVMDCWLLNKYHSHKVLE